MLCFVFAAIIPVRIQHDGNKELLVELPKERTGAFLGELKTSITSKCYIY